MKPQIKFFEEKAQPQRKPAPEDVTLYGTGAGLYSYLNMLAKKLANGELSSRKIQIQQ